MTRYRVFVDQPHGLFPVHESHEWGRALSAWRAAVRDPKNANRQVYLVDTDTRKVVRSNKVPVADTPSSVSGDPAPVEPTVGQPTAPGVGRPDPVLAGQELARRILTELDRDDGGTI